MLLGLAALFFLALKAANLGNFSTERHLPDHGALRQHRRPEGARAGAQRRRHRRPGDGHHARRARPSRAWSAWTSDAASSSRRTARPRSSPPACWATSTSAWSRAATRSQPGRRRHHHADAVGAGAGEPDRPVAVQQGGRGRQHAGEQEVKLWRPVRGRAAIAGAGFGGAVQRRLGAAQQSCRRPPLHGVAAAAEPDDVPRLARWPTRGKTSTARCSLQPGTRPGPAAVRGPMPTSTLVPELVRIGVDNFFANAQDLWSAVNNLLQGKLEQVGDDDLPLRLQHRVRRRGLIDMATELGIERIARGLRPDARRVGHDSRGPTWCCPSSARRPCAMRVGPAAGHRRVAGLCHQRGLVPAGDHGAADPEHALAAARQRRSCWTPSPWTSTASCAMPSSAGACAWCSTATRRKTTRSARRHRQGMTLCTPRGASALSFRPCSPI